MKKHLTAKDTKATQRKTFNSCLFIMTWETADEFIMTASRRHGVNI